MSRRTTRTPAGSVILFSLRFVYPGDERIQPLQSTLPKFLVADDPVLSISKGSGVKPETMQATVDFTADKSGLFKHFQMFGNCRLGDVERLSYFVCRQGAPGRQHGDNLPTRSVAESVENAIQRLLIMYSHVAIYMNVDLIVNEYASTPVNMLRVSRTAILVLLYGFSDMFPEHRAFKLNAPPTQGVEQIFLIKRTTLTASRTG